MLPDWTDLQKVWPFLLAFAGVWGRLEVTLSRAREQSVKNESEIMRLQGEVQKLESQIEDQRRAGQAQALQLARIEESLSSIGRTLERMDRKISGP